MIRTIITDYQSAESDIRHIRDQVFVIEQQVARELEFDGRDPLCAHALVYDGKNAVATGRIDVENEGKVGRVAVLLEHRRSGLGTLIMEALEQHAMRGGLAKVWFHAQIHAVPFYLALGYAISSKEFEEAGIPHVVMCKRLRQI